MSNQHPVVALEPGKRTSEFWMTLVGAILGFLKATWLPDLPEETFYLAITYVGGRSLRKGLKKG